MPEAHLGQYLDARADRELVKLYTSGSGGGRLVKTHPRQAPGRRSTDRADLPEHRAGYALRDLTALIATSAGMLPSWARRLYGLPGLPATTLGATLAGRAAMLAAAAAALVATAALPVVDSTTTAHQISTAAATGSGPGCPSAWPWTRPRGRTARSSAPPS